MLETFSSLLLQAGILGIAMLMGANLYEAVVGAPNWKEPALLKAYRGFAVRRNPGHFFRILSPMTLAALLLSLALGWSGMDRRDVLMLSAFACGVAAEIFTVAIFFPLNKVMFDGNSDDGEAHRAVLKWVRANRLRILITFGAFCFALRALTAG